MGRTNDAALANWPRAWALALEDAALEDASSAAIFKRGLAYAASGCVQVVAEDPMPEPALRALVTGTEIYTTDLWMEDDALAGDCDCPHAQDGRFCKHQVAVALVWRERLAHASGSHSDVPGAAPAAARPRTVKAQRRALQDFLRGLEPSILVDKLIDLADRDRDIWRELQQWRKLGEMKGGLVDVKPMIDEILSPGRDFIAWDEVASYVRRADAALPLLREARERHPAEAISLCAHALRRVWRALESADDSNGEIGGVCEAIGAELTRAVHVAGPQPASFGDAYFQLRLDDPFDCFDAAAVEAAMGEAALARYRQILAERWRAAKDEMLALRAKHAAKATRKDRADIHVKTQECERRLLTLEPLHLAQLKQMDADDEALAILREDLSDAYAHSRVVQFLEAAGRFSEAFEQARTGCAAFPDDWRLQEHLLRCYEREGLVREALALQRSRFEQRPSVDGYHLVLGAGAAAGEDATVVRAALFDFLQRQEQAEIGRPSPLSVDWGRARRGPAMRDVTLRAEILGSEGRWIEACELVRPPVECRHHVLHSIAIHLPDERQDHAVELLLRVFEAVIQRSSTPHREALALVGEIGQRMDAARRQDWLTQLRAQYKLKRNFIRDLPRQ